MADPTPEAAGYVLDEYDAPRFWAHVDFRGGRAYLDDPLVDQRVVDGECWRWRGWNSDGYGSFRVWGRIVVAHRIAFRDFGHTLGDDLDIDHLCRVHECVRPDHLEPVTHVANIERGRTSLLNRTNCRNGHALSSEVIGTRMSNGRPVRYCTLCRTERAKAT